MTPRNARALAGLSLTELGKRVGASPATLSRMENGQGSNPRSDLRRKVEEVLSNGPLDWPPLQARTDIRRTPSLHRLEERLEETRELIVSVLHWSGRLQKRLDKAEARVANLSQHIAGIRAYIGLPTEEP